MNNVDLFLDAHAKLAEGPSWCSLRQRLIWVDILAKRIHFSNLESGQDEFIQLDVMVSAACPYRDADTLVVATENGVGILSQCSEKIDWIANPEEDKPANRFNDGKIGPDGKFWAGTMRIDGEGNREGALYRFDLEQRTFEKLVDHVGLSNGLDWHQKRFFYVDTHRGQVDVFDYDGANISNRRNFYRVKEGFPDGLFADFDGSVWLALWGAGKVIHLSQHGELIRSINVPAKNVSSVCRAKDRIFISTASDTVGTDQSDSKIESGSIYSLS